MRLFFLILTLLVTSFAEAARNPNSVCGSGYWIPRGNVIQVVDKFDSLLVEKADFSKLNQFKDSQGFPVSVSVPSDQAAYYKNRLEGDDIGGGVMALVFLKKMAVDQKSGFSLDEVHEALTVDATKPSKTWHLPYNDSSPAGIRGDELLYKTTLRPICDSQDVETEVLLSVKSDGSFRILDPEKVTLPTSTYLKEDQCPAAKSFFKESSYSRCYKYQDVISKKDRFIIFNEPMT